MGETNPITIRCKYCEGEFPYIPTRTLGGSKGIAAPKLERQSPLIKCEHCGKKALYAITVEWK